MGGTDGALVAVPGTEKESVRASTVHHQLLVAEREIAELREETAMRAAELDAMRSALQREHEQNLRLQSKHQQEMDHIRSEYERQNSQLVEQLTVLKGVSENALAEKRVLGEENAQKKQQLMQLLEREREEKSQIMADYRQQTEALITEQGREITGLRNLLEAAREEEEKLLAAAKRQEERRNETEEALLKLETQLADERVATQRRQRELEQRHQTQLDTLRHQQELDQNEIRAQLLKANSTKDHSEDQCRTLQEKLKSQELAADAERQRLRTAYDTDVETLQAELQALKTSKQSIEHSLNAELERTKTAHEEVVASLRRDVEHTRHERQAAADEARVQKDVMVAEYTRKTNELQLSADNARKELVEERALRKDSDSARQSAVLENDALKANVSRLSLDLENLQLDARTRERNLEQNFHEQSEQLRAQVRSLETELSKAKAGLQRQELEATRLQEELKSRVTQHESDVMDARRKNEALRIAIEDANAQREEESTHAAQQVDTLTSRKVALEAEVARLDRSLAESEARNVSTTKQLSTERRALETATNDIQSLKQQVGDINTQLDSERSKCSSTLATLSEKESEVMQCRESIAEMNTALREANRDTDRLRDEIEQQKREFDETLTARSTQHRRELSSLEEQVQQVSKTARGHQEARGAAEEHGKQQREEIHRWERRCVEKDETHQDAVRALRREHEEELLRMDTVVNTLRDDLARVQSQKAQSQREALDATRDVDRRVAIVQEALDTERANKQRLHDELRAKEQLVAEVQGTVRLLTTRLASKEDDLRRADSELHEATDKVHEAHSVLGKKDAHIGQLMAKLRVYESRGTL